MGGITVEVPEDIREEFGAISMKEWQLLFSRFLRRELEEAQRVESIVSKSKMTQEQADRLANEVSQSIAKRLLKE